MKENKRQKTEKSVKNKKIFKRVAYIVGAVVVLVGVFFGGWFARWFSLDSDMRSLITVKETIDREYYEDISDEHFYDVIFDAINNKVLDRYSYYMNAEEYTADTEDMKGNRVGIGLVLLTSDSAGNAQMLITRVCGNSPAEKANIPVGAKIIGFGKTETTLTKSEVYDEFCEFLNTCAEGEKFAIAYVYADETHIVELCRSSYVENLVFYRTNSNAYTFMGEKATAAEKGNPISVLDEETAYIRLVQFAGNAVAEFDGAMGLFKQERKKNLVLDLRGNGGGYMDTLIEIAKYFCKDGGKTPIVAIADYGEKKEKFKASKNLYSEYFSQDSRICILADGDTASASECLIGCLIDYGATKYADVCLTEYNGIAKTYGKGIMQTTYHVDYIKGDAIQLTTAEIRWPVSNHCIHNRGVLSSDGTRTVQQNYAGETELENAIKALFS